MAPFLSLSGAVVVHDDRRTLDVPELEVYEGEVLGIIGPNGAGKSTLLRVLAMLQRPLAGKLQFAGQQLDLRQGDALDLRRRLAVVMQDPLLLNRSVHDNVAIGLGFRGMDKREQAERVERWLGKFGVLELSARSARTLSGGEAQRVSLARAFALEPEVLMLDEPFSALDAPTRTVLLDDMSRILAETRVTTVLVTHDRGEALALSDRLAVMVDGRIRQLDLPQKVFNEPVDDEVAAFVGVENILSGTVLEQTEGLARIEVEGRQIQAVCDCPAGQRVRVFLRPEDVTIRLVSEGVTEEGSNSSARNHLAATVERVTSLGPLARVVLDCGFRLVASVTHQSFLDLGLRPGQPVTIDFKATSPHVIRDDRSAPGWQA